MARFLAAEEDEGIGLSSPPSLSYPPPPSHTLSYQPRQLPSSTSDDPPPSLIEDFPPPASKDDEAQHQLPIASSSASSTTLPRKKKIRSRLQRLVAWTAGPSSGPQPLSVAKPLLEFSLTLGRGGGKAWRPDEAWMRVWTSRVRRWAKRNVWKKGLVLSAFFAVWIVGFAFLVRKNSFLSRTEPSLGGDVSVLGCTSTFWTAENGCGLDGGNCLSSGSLTFRCPGACAGQLLYNPRAVGDLLPDFVTLVVGGGQEDEPVYRADSFICASAIHAGLISSSTGGCGILNLLTSDTSPSIANTTYPSSDANGVSSIPFPTTFPNAFTFTPCKGYNCNDLRWGILGFHVGMFVVLGVFLDPDPLVWFWTLCSVGYWHVILVADQRANPPVVADAFQDFLPFLFLSYFFWRIACRFTLPSFFASAPLETVLWSVGGWIPGVLFAAVTTKIPVDTLTAGDISNAAVIWVVFLIIVIVLLVGIQISWMWRTGWLRFYAGWTIACALVIVVLSQLPDLTFRLHHYIFAIFFVPALGFATRPSLLLQWFLIGIACAGIGKFGWESILQTVEELQRDAALDTSIPTLVTNSTNWGGLVDAAFVNSSLLWNAIPSELANDWNGFSLLVDDVERYVGTETNFSFVSLSPLFPHFFRLAYQLDGTSGAYTKAAVWLANGTWSDPPPGGT